MPRSFHPKPATLYFPLWSSATIILQSHAPVSHQRKIKCMYMKYRVMEIQVHESRELSSRILMLNHISNLTRKIQEGVGCVSASLIGQAVCLVIPWVEVKVVDNWDYEWEKNHLPMSFVAWPAVAWAATTWQVLGRHSLIVTVQFRKFAPTLFEASQRMALS